MRNFILFTEIHNRSSQSAGRAGAKLSSYYSQLLFAHGWRPLVLTCPGNYNEQGRSFSLDEIEQQLNAQINQDEIVIRLQPKEGVGQKLVRASHHIHEISDQLTGFPCSFLEGWASILTGVALMSGNDHNTGGGWASVATEAAIRISQLIKVDAVLAMTGWAPLFAAHRLNKATGIPWVLYFHDPWQAFVSEHGRSLMGWYFRHFLFNSSSAVAHCTPRWCMEVSHELRRPAACLINAYDSNFLDTVQPIVYNRLTIVYTGAIESISYNPRVFLSGLALLKAQKPDLFKELQFVYVGTQVDLIKQRAQEYGVLELLHCTGPLAHADVFRYTMGAHLLLVSLNQDEPLNFGRLLSKTPEYIGSGRPILLIPQKSNRKDSDLIRLIRDTGTGWVAWDAEEVCSLLSNLLDQYRSTGQTTRPGNGTLQVGDLTYQGQAGKLGQILERVSKGERDPVVEDLQAEYPWSRDD